MFLSTLVQNILKHFTFDNSNDLLHKTKFLNSPDDYEYDFLCRISIEFSYNIEKTMNALFNKYYFLKQNQDIQKTISESKEI